MTDPARHSTDTPALPLSVTFLMRAPQERSFSIEAVFETVRAHLPPDITARVVTSAYPSRGFLPRLKGVFHAWRACKGADIIHMTGDAHFLVFLLPRKRVVLTVHDCEFLVRSHGIKRFILWLFWIWLPARKACKITVVSEESKRQLLQWLRVDPDRIEVIENPLSKALPQDDRPFATARPRLLMIGTGPHKNIDRVAQALTGLPVILEVIGRLPPERLTRLQAEGLDVQTRHDLSDAQLAQAYASADILMFPSLSEGFGLPILEAQSVGRPVITSDRSPMREVAGPAALLVDPENPSEIRNAVERVIAEPELRKVLVRDGFTNINRFAPKTTATQYANLYRQMAKEL